MKKAILIDYSNLNYRFRYVHQNLNTGVVSTGEQLGWYNSIKRMDATADIYIALDGCPLRSNSLNTSYKSTREHDSGVIYPSLLDNLKKIRSFAVKFSRKLHFIFIPNAEADQVMATFVKVALGRKNDGFGYYELEDDAYLSSLSSCEYGDFNSEVLSYDQIIMLTRDSDLYQLTEDPRVFISIDTIGNMVTPVTPKAVHCLDPKYIVAYKTLVGDKSDNVPGLMTFKEFLKLNTLVDLSSSALENYISKGFPKELEHLDFGKFVSNYKIVKLDYTDKLRELYV